MFLAGENEEEAVRHLAPYTVHTHITDAIRHADGSFRLVLLGQGQLDTAAFVRAMHRCGWDGFLTVEVSMMVWGAQGYDPMVAAKESYTAITRAFETAGVPRG